MKQVSLVLSALALIGVAILFGMNMNGKKSNPKILNAKDAAGALTNAQGVKIAFVNVDTLQEKNPFFTQQKKELEKRDEGIKSELKRDYANLENEYRALKQKAESGGISQTEGQAVQQRLMAQQQNLDKKREDLSNKLLNDSDDFNDQWTKMVHEKVKEYAEENGYDAVLMGSQGSGVLYYNPNYDATQDIIELMKDVKESKTK